MPDSARAAAVAALPDRICFLGFGLIGGSIALALREAGSTAHLVAWTPSGTGPSEGLRRGLIDAAATSIHAAIDGAGLVVLAGPPSAVVGLVRQLSTEEWRSVGRDTVITDVASTKGAIVAMAEEHQRPFVGGHPMAGIERSGVGAATGDLFVGRPWIVVPAELTPREHVDRVAAFATATGARPIEMTADAHDAAVAAVSHLPLVLAAALVESVAADAAAWTSLRPLAAGGWQGMTRLARGDPEMGAGILATNSRPVIERLRAYQDAIDSWITELEAVADHRMPVALDVAAEGRLRARLQRARDVLDRGGTA